MCKYVYPQMPPLNKGQLATRHQHSQDFSQFVLLGQHSAPLIGCWGQPPAACGHDPEQTAHLKAKARYQRQG